jgi:hypothetical protein
MMATEDHHWLLILMFLATVLLKPRGLSSVALVHWHSNDNWPACSMQHVIDGDLRSMSSHPTYPTLGRVATVGVL